MMVKWNEWYGQSWFISCSGFKLPLSHLLGFITVVCDVSLMRKKTTKTEHIQSNLNSSNTNGLFTMANSNSFLSPFEILPMLKKTNVLGNFLISS